jgi:hypothetical protein
VLTQHRRLSGERQDDDNQKKVDGGGGAKAHHHGEERPWSDRDCLRVESINCLRSSEGVLAQHLRPARKWAPRSVERLCGLDGLNARNTASPIKMAVARMAAAAYSNSITKISQPNTTAAHAIEKRNCGTSRLIVVSPAPRGKVHALCAGQLVYLADCLFSELLFDVSVDRLGKGALKSNHGIVLDQDILLDEPKATLAGFDGGSIQIFVDSPFGQWNTVRVSLGDQSTQNISACVQGGHRANMRPDSKLGHQQI